jgi:hypothetical protein
MSQSSLKRAPIDDVGFAAGAAQSTTSALQRVLPVNSDRRTYVRALGFDRAQVILGRK